MIFTQDSSFGFRVAKEKEIQEKAKGKFVIALDFDGVITAPYILKTAYINERGYSIMPEESGREDCLRLGVTKEDYDEGSIRAYTEKPGTLPLEENFQKHFTFIRALRDTFIAIVTSRYDHMLAHAEEYLRYHEIKIDAVVNTQYGNKGAYLDMLSARIFVEDTVSKLMEAKKDRSQHSLCKYVLYRNVHNQRGRVNDVDIVEVKNWKELKDFIVSEYNKVIK